MFKWCSHASPQQWSGEIEKDKALGNNLKLESGGIARYVHVQPSNSCSDSDQISPAPYKACVTGNHMEPAQEEEKALLNYSLIITTFFEGFVFIEGDKMILLVFFWTSISDSTSADHPDYPR